MKYKTLKKLSIIIIIITIINIKIITDYEITKPTQKYTLSTQKKTVAQVIDFSNVQPEEAIEIENKNNEKENINKSTEINEENVSEQINTAQNGEKEKDGTESDSASFEALASALSNDTIVNNVETYQLIQPLNETPSTEPEISEPEPVVEASVENTTDFVGTDIVDTAVGYIGANYVSGGSSPETGFDCSGFTQYIYGLYGISLNRVASAQADNGTAISKEDLQPGDLVLFSYYGSDSIGHSGIYIGNGNFVHAANSSRGVVTDTLESGYYLDNYVTARRVY